MPNKDPQSQKSAHRQQINKPASIASIFFGLVVAINGVLLGFSLAHGDIKRLWVFPEMVGIMGLVVGGLSISFGPMRSIRILLDALYGNDAGSTERLRTNIQICECGAKLSVLAGIAVTLLGFVVAFDTLGGEITEFGLHIAYALMGIIYGTALSVVVFIPLKYRFSHRATEEIKETS